MTTIAMEGAEKLASPSSLIPDMDGGVAVVRKRAQHIDAAIDFMSGVAGGVASVYVGQPLDTVKVKIQTFPHLYRNAWDCFKKTYHKEGIGRGLYAGSVPSLAAQVSENAILFMAYGFCQKGVALVLGRRDVSQLSALENACAGGSAAFFSSLALCPTELVKCKLQAMHEVTGQAAQQGPRIGPWLLTKQIIRTEGVQGLFRGLTATLVREMPGYFFFFGGYEICRTLLTPEGKSKDDLGPLATIFCGGMGGVTLWTTVFPADVIKSRAQVSTSAVPLTFLQAFLQILKTEGIPGLYRGLGPTVLRTFPATGALFLAYETTKKFLQELADGPTSPSSTTS